VLGEARLRIATVSTRRRQDLSQTSVLAAERRPSHAQESGIPIRDIPKRVILSAAVPRIRKETRTVSGDVRRGLGVLSDDLRRGLGMRRASRLARAARHAQLPPEALLDLALDLLEVLNRRLTLTSQPAVGLATDRWKRLSAQARSAALRRVAQARWAPHERKQTRLGKER
jgi:hypothetical protein